MKNILLVFLILFLVSCELASHTFETMNDFSQQVNKVLSDKCKSKVLVNFNGGMLINGKIIIKNANVQFFSKNPPSCSIKEVEDEFFKFLKLNKLNPDVNLTIIPWEKPSDK